MVTRRERRLTLTFSLWACAISASAVRAADDSLAVPPIGAPVAKYLEVPEGESLRID
jgi:hypothetical protein